MASKFKNFLENIKNTISTGAKKIAEAVTGSREDNTEDKIKQTEEKIKSTEKQVENTFSDIFNMINERSSEPPISEGKNQEIERTSKKGKTAEEMIEEMTKGTDARIEKMIQETEKKTGINIDTMKQETTLSSKFHTPPNSEEKDKEAKSPKSNNPQQNWSVTLEKAGPQNSKDSTQKSDLKPTLAHELGSIVKDLSEGLKPNQAAQENPAAEHQVNKGGGRSMG